MAEDLKAAFTDPEETLWQYIEVLTVPSQPEHSNSFHVSGAFVAMQESGLSTQKSIERARAKLRDWRDRVSEIREFPPGIEIPALTDEGRRLVNANTCRNELIIGSLTILYWNDPTAEDRELVKPFADVNYERIREVAVAISTGSKLEYSQ